MFWLYIYAPNIGNILYHNYQSLKAYLSYDYMLTESFTGIISCKNVP